MCRRCHCPVLFIYQNVKIWIEYCPSRILTSITVFVAVFTVFIIRITRKYWCSRSGIWRGSGFILRFFIIFIWISRLVLVGRREFTGLLLSNGFLSSLLWWILSPCAFLFMWRTWTVSHTILWIHGCWTSIYVLLRWKWRHSLTRPGSFVSSGTTSLFNWRWWDIHIWDFFIWYLISFWSNHRLSLWFLWHLCMKIC